MDENKEKELNATEDERLKQELEELAKTFQEELDKAKAEEAAKTETDDTENTENEGELIQELEDLEHIEEEEDEIPEKELCVCCGEKRRGTKKNPDSEYCYECEKALRHYPFELLNVIIPVLAVAFCLYGCYIFSNYMSIYTSAQQADKYVSQNKLYTAYSAYDTAVNKMKAKKVNGEMIYKRSLDCAYKSGEFLNSSVDTAVFKEWELKLPHLKSVYDIQRETLEMDATRAAIEGIIYQYDVENVEDLPYDKIIKEIEALTDEPAKMAPLIDGETEEEISTTTAYNIKVKRYNRPMILYYEFYLSVVCEKDIETQISFLEKIREESPEKTWLYAAMLGDLYNKSGKDTTEICKYMRSINSEDTGADVIEATALRIKGKYDESIEICNKFIDREDIYMYEFCRQKAICYLLKGDYSTAYKAAYEAYSQSTIPLTANLLMICSIATENTDVYDEIAELYAESEVDISEEVLAYKDGTMTLEQIFTKGDFDVA